MLLFVSLGFFVMTAPFFELFLQDLDFGQGQDGNIDAGVDVITEIFKILDGSGW